MSFFVFFHTWGWGGSEASVEFYTLFFEPFPKKLIAEWQLKFVKKLYTTNSNIQHYSMLTKFQE